MTYEEYLSILDNLAVNSSQIEKDKLFNSNLNPELRVMIEPKIVELIKQKYINVVTRISKLIGEMFSDQYILDQQLVNFKKEVLFIYELTKLKELSDDPRNDLQNMIEEETDKIYKVFINKANEVDMSGALGLTIKHSMIKWR